VTQIFKATTPVNGIALFGLDKTFFGEIFKTDE
jgi:hypothetical protein